MYSRVALLALALVGCGGHARHDAALTVFAASSLTDAFGEIARSFEGTRDGVRVELNFAGSHVLRTQIEQGALADAIASADEVNMQALVAGGLVEPATAFARNRLVVAASSRNASVRSLADLASPGVRVVVATPEAPVGRYTQQMLDLAAADPALGASFAADVRSHVVSRETNVRLVLAKVLLGEADAGVVYRTDVSSQQSDVRIIDIPESLNVLADYPIAVVAGTDRGDDARAFVDFVLSDAGRGILSDYGFLLPESGPRSRSTVTNR
ncbi:molybdate ABC transporter substrate-binding protein [Candidatus Poribacteria bacterium]|nr:molybdate ABC transporter substrate-binding protein [Candidatus Poribacteria bacterium]